MGLEMEFFGDGMIYLVTEKFPDSKEETLGQLRGMTQCVLSLTN